MMRSYWIGTFTVGLFAIVVLLAAMPAALAQAATSQAPAPAMPKAVQIDPKAVALLAEVDAKMHTLKSFSADFTWTTPPNKYRSDTATFRATGSVRLMKPNFAFAEGWEEEDDPTTGARGRAILGQVWWCDGKSYSHWWHDGEITTKPADPSGANVRVGFGLCVNSFFNGDSLVKEVAGDERDAQSYTVRLGSPVTISGVPCRLVETADVDSSQGVVFHGNEFFYIGPDLFVHRFVIDLQGDRGETRTTVDLTHIAVDQEMAVSSFAFTPPKAAQPEFAMPPGGAAAATPPPVLLANGALAPNFTVQDTMGHPVKLSDYKGKVVVLDFWATWCGPCQASFPHTNDVAARFKGKGVVILAVNVWDTPDAFRYWVPKHKSYDALVFALDTRDYGRYVTSLYHVPGVPTQYVIDPSGKIVASFVGYDKPTDDLANAIQKAAERS